MGKQKDKSTLRQLASIHWMSHYLQVIQGLMKELMTQTVDETFPTAQIDKSPPNVGKLLAHSPQQESKGHGGECSSWNTIYLEWTMCCNSCSMSTERKFWSFYWFVVKVQHGSQGCIKKLPSYYTWFHFKLFKHSFILSLTVSKTTQL